MLYTSSSIFLQHCNAIVYLITHEFICVYAGCHWVPPLLYMRIQTNFLIKHKRNCLPAKMSTMPMFLFILSIHFESCVCVNKFLMFGSSMCNNKNAWGFIFRKRDVPCNVSFSFWVHCTSTSTTNSTNNEIHSGILCDVTFGSI